MSAGSVNSSGTSPISVTGLASGLDTSSIIKALLEAERQPITRITNQEEKLSGQQGQLQAIKSSLIALGFAAEEFALPSVFEGVQSVSSSEPARVERHHHRRRGCRRLSARSHPARELGTAHVRVREPGSGRHGDDRRP